MAGAGDTRPNQASSACMTGTGKKTDSIGKVMRARRIDEDKYYVRSKCSVVRKDIDR